jgi:hypothetical protein
MTIKTLHWESHTSLQSVTQCTLTFRSNKDCDFQDKNQFVDKYSSQGLLEKLTKAAEF